MEFEQHASTDTGLGSVSPVAAAADSWSASHSHSHTTHNADFFSSGEPIVLEPSVTEPVDPLVFESLDEDEDLPQSSIDNIIPIQNIKHGLQVMGGVVEKTALKVSEKANEVYNSEQFQTAKRKTTEAIAPAWEKTCEVAAPVWEQTKLTASKAAEKTREATVPVWEQTKATAAVAAAVASEKTQEAAQKMKPAMQQFGRQLSDATCNSWRFLSAVALSAAEATQKLAAEVMGDDDDTPANPTNTAPIAQSNEPRNEFDSKPMSI